MRQWPSPGALRTKQPSSPRAFSTYFQAGAEALVPAIWPVEVANALLIAERRNRIVLAQVTALLQRIAALPIAVLPIDAPRAFDHILPVARQQSLSGYDAAYLDLVPAARPPPWPRWMSNCAARLKPRASSCCRRLLVGRRGFLHPIEILVNRALTVIT